MTKTICLDEKYSTTRLLTKDKPWIVTDFNDKFKSVLFLQEGKKRKGEGGLRKKGYFKKSYGERALVSIITVVYNDEKHLEKTILSVINQTYDNAEHIIVDGGSTDKTMDIIKKYENKIDYWVSESDNGIYNAMNKGLKLASGKLGIFLNSGDSFAEKNMLLNVFHYIKDKKGSDFDFVVGNTKRDYGDSYFISNSKPTFFCNPRKGMEFSHQSVFFKVALHKKIPFSEEFKLMADFNFFCQCVSIGCKFIYVPVTISNFVTGGLSRQNWKTNIIERYKIFKKYTKSPTISNYLSFIDTILRFVVVALFIKEARLKKIKSLLKMR